MPVFYVVMCTDHLATLISEGDSRVIGVQIADKYENCGYPMDTCSNNRPSSHEGEEKHRIRVVVKYHTDDLREKQK